MSLTSYEGLQDGPYTNKVINESTNKTTLKYVAQTMGILPQTSRRDSDNNELGMIINSETECLSSNTLVIP